MKTETLTIRLTPEDKKLISDLAWMRRQSMAELIIQMAREQPEVEKEDNHE